MFLEEDTNPEYSYDYLEQGIQFKDLGRDLEALACLSRAIVLDEENVEAYVVRSKIYARQKNLIAAIDDLELALKFGVVGMFDEGRPNESCLRAIALSDLGKIYLDQGYLKQAIDYLQQLLDLNQRGMNLVSLSLASVAHLVLAKAYRLQGELDAAIDHFNQAFQLGLAEFSEDYYLRGVVHLSNGRPEKAIDDFSQSILISGGRESLPFAARAWIYFNQGKKFLAMQDFEAAIGLDADCELAYLFLARMNEMSGNNEDAIGYYKKVWKEEDGSPELRGYAGVRLHKLQPVRKHVDLSAVIAALRRKRPKFAEDHCVLALLMRAQGDTEKAIQGCKLLLSGDFFLPNAIPLYLQEEFVDMLCGARCLQACEPDYHAHEKNSVIRVQLIDMIAGVQHIGIQVQAVVQMLSSGETLLGEMFAGKNKWRINRLAGEVCSKANRMGRYDLAEELEKKLNMQNESLGFFSHENESFMCDGVNHSQLIVNRRLS